MKPEGWAFLVFGWGITIALFVYCFTRILLGDGVKRG
jgi:glycerol uptake facilitator-like aquaporin